MTVLKSFFVSVKTFGEDDISLIISDKGNLGVTVIYHIFG